MGLEWSEYKEMFSVPWLEDLTISDVEKIWPETFRKVQYRCSRRQVASPFEQCPSVAVVRLIDPERIHEPHEVACLPCLSALIEQFSGGKQLLIEKLRK